MSDPVFASAEAADAVLRQYREVLERWPVAKTELQVPTREGSTFVIACGPKAAPPVVLLHGSLGNSAAWMGAVPLWAQKFRLYAVDLIGEPGLSARVRPKLRSDAYALWLGDVLAGLGLARAAFIGASLGGWVALDYASRKPQAVQALALIGPAGVGRQKNFLLKAVPLLLLGAWGRRKLREIVFGPAPEVSPEAGGFLASLMENMGKAVKPRVVLVPKLSEKALQRLHMPVLAIAGGRDVLFDAADMRDRLERNAPQAEICFLEEGHHFLPGGASRVMHFLESVEDRA